MDKKCDGWTNWATWSVALNLNSNYNVDRMAFNAVKRYNESLDFKNWFKSTFKIGSYYEVYDRWSEDEIENVNWDEIYNSYLN